MFLFMQLMIQCS